MSHSTGQMCLLLFKVAKSVAPVAESEAAPGGATGGVRRAWGPYTRPRPYTPGRTRVGWAGVPPGARCRPGGPQRGAQESF